MFFGGGMPFPGMGGMPGMPGMGGGGARRAASTPVSVPLMNIWRA